MSGKCDAIVSTPPESIEAQRKGCNYLIDFAEYGLNYALGGIAARRDYIERHPEITQKFIELAGGPDSPIVVLPIAAGDSLPDGPTGDERLFERAGAKKVKSLRARRKVDVESAEFSDTLAEATR